MIKTFSHSHAKQLRLPLSTPTALVNHFAEKGADERGAVYTRREVVDFILDLAGYTTDKPLFKFRLIEPSFGEGDFLLPIIERLLVAYSREFSVHSREPFEELSAAIPLMMILTHIIILTLSPWKRLKKISLETITWI